MSCQVDSGANHIGSDQRKCDSILKKSDWIGSNKKK
jgi:hypothetical protein